MELIESITGNIHDDPELASAHEHHKQNETAEYAVIEADDRVKSRLRVTTTAGTELGIVSGSTQLQDGDVLLHDDTRMIILQFAEEDAFVIELPENIPTETAVTLGHRIGNQHWDIAVDGYTVYFPMEADRDIIEDVLAEVIPSNATTTTTTVDPAMFIDSNSTAVDHHHTDQSHQHNHDSRNSHHHDH